MCSIFKLLPSKNQFTNIYVCKKNLILIENYKYLKIAKTAQIDKYVENIIMYIKLAIGR